MTIETLIYHEDDVQRINKSKKIILKHENKLPKVISSDDSIYKPNPI